MKRRRCLYVVDYLLTPEKRIDNAAVLCENNRILAVGGISGFSMEDRLNVYRFKNAYLTPGFIDMHIHGCGGFDCSSVAESPNSIADMSLLLAQRGITSFVPTVVADQPDKMISNLELLAGSLTGDLPGACADMINIEGPFLNPDMRGSQDGSAIRPIDIGFARELIQAGRGKVKLMTFAPELPNAAALIEFLTESGVIPSMGHSLANEEETLRAIDAGASHCTHLFNGMPPMRQREMSLTNVAMTDRRVSVEIIIDGRHVHPRMIDMACRCKIADNIIGISDCTMAAGMPNGEYRIGPSVITVENGFSKNAQRRLAGTTTMLDAGWHCLMSSGHLTEIRAAAAVTVNPAKVLGLNDRGVLLPNKRADLAVFECKTNRLLMAVRHGDIVYQAEQ